MESEIIAGLIQRIEKLDDEVRLLKTQRITQVQIVPDSIKMRAMGEGIRFVRGGATADKPTEGEEPDNSCAVYYDEGVNKLWIWNKASSTWKFVTLS